MRIGMLADKYKTQVSGVTNSVIYLSAARWRCINMLPGISLWFLPPIAVAI